MIEMKLSDDVIRSIATMQNIEIEKVDNVQTKFDEKGTLHLMQRNDDGKLLKDIPIKELNITPSYQDELRREYKELKSSPNSGQKTLQILSTIGISVLLLLTALTFCVIFTIAK